jgi:hypothetical protein
LFYKRKFKGTEIDVAIPNGCSRAKAKDMEEEEEWRTMWE